MAKCNLLVSFSHYKNKSWNVGNHACDKFLKLYPRIGVSGMFLLNPFAAHLITH